MEWWWVYLADLVKDSDWVSKARVVLNWKNILEVSYKSLVTPHSILSLP